MHPAFPNILVCVALLSPDMHPSCPDIMSFCGQQGLTYRAAGVDIDAGDALVEAIKPLAKRTRRPGCDAELGGFGGAVEGGEEEMYG